MLIIGVVFNSDIESFEKDDSIMCYVSSNSATKVVKTYNTEFGKTICEAIGGIEIGSLARNKMKIESKVKLDKWAPSFKFMDLTQSWVAYKSEKIEWLK